MQTTPFNGLGMNLGNLSLISNAETRSISSENPNGAKSGGGRYYPSEDEEGRPSKTARHLGPGWKARPLLLVPANETVEIANIDGPGAIQSMWMTINGTYRYSIIRIYWDGQEQPSVECPIGDFFATPYQAGFHQVTSQAVCVNPGSAFNCFWEMPFRKNCRITLENLHSEQICIYYQINYTLTEVSPDAAYVHAQFRRSNPVPKGQVHTLLDGIQGKGHYVGTSIGWQPNHNRWWGEGEIKFYLDGDTDPALSDGKEVGGSTGYPTICGTGTEDYFGGSYNFENRATKKYQEFNGPYIGMPYASPSHEQGMYDLCPRFSLYRWHIMDPIRFQHDIKVTIQSLAHRDHNIFYQSPSDIASVAFWYQTLPTAPFPEFPDYLTLENV